MTVEELRKAWARFDPRRPLKNGELEKYYVEVPYSHIDELRTRLSLNAEHRTPSKFLFSGHRGCGKSTALFKLISELGDGFFVVYYSVSEVLDINDVSHIDVLFSIVSRMLKEAVEQEVKIGEDVQKRLNNWGKKITETVTKEESSEASMGAGINFFVNLMARIKNEDTTRKELRREIEPRISELIDIINDLTVEIERHFSFKKQVLVIVDDLEKIEYVERAKFIFQRSQLVQPKCHIIYTYPISLHYSAQSNPIQGMFDWTCMHPNIKVFERGGEPGTEGRKILRKIVEMREPGDIFESGVLDYIIEMSGGVIKEMLRIIQDAISESITLQKEKIDMETAENVVTEMRNIYRKQLSAEDKEILREVMEGKRGIGRDEKLVDLLHNLSLLEYRNREIWCGVNPIVAPLLRENGGARSMSDSP